jgi:putative sterol carrier protein
MARPVVNVEQARRSVSRKLSRAPAQLAEGFASVVRNAPQDRLEQILRTPARRVVLAGIFWQMPQHIDRNAVKAVDATIRWRITSDSESTEVYELVLKDGRVRSRRGESGDDATVTLTLSAAEFVKLATGNSDPMQAYFKGRIKLAGDIMLAARLQTLFRIPGRGRSQPGGSGSTAQPSSTVSSSR